MGFPKKLVDSLEAVCRFIELGLWAFVRFGIERPVTKRADLAASV